jgi:hypothetical protein
VVACSTAGLGLPSIGNAELISVGLRSAQIDCRVDGELVEEELPHAPKTTLTAKISDPRCRAGMSRPGLMLPPVAK